MSRSQSINVTINIEPLPENIHITQAIQKTLETSLKPLGYQRTSGSWLKKSIKLNFTKIRYTNKKTKNVN